MLTKHAGHAGQDAGSGVDNRVVPMQGFELLSFRRPCPSLLILLFFFFFSAFANKYSGFELLGKFFVVLPGV